MTDFHHKACYGNVRGGEIYEAMETVGYRSLTAMQQSDIGWHLFIEGWCVIEWETEQQLYYKLIQSQCSGHKWLVSLIKQSWTIAWELWEHQNESLHRKDNEIRATEERHLNHGIRILYSKAYAEL
jgi:hypothetical protein